MCDVRQEATDIDRYDSQCLRQLRFHVQYNKIYAVIILQALAAPTYFILLQMKAQLKSVRDLVVRALMSCHVELELTVCEKHYCHWSQRESHASKRQTSLFRHKIPQTPTVASNNMTDSTGWAKSSYPLFSFVITFRPTLYTFRTHVTVTVVKTFWPTLYKFRTHVAAIVVKTFWPTLYKFKTHVAATVVKKLFGPPCINLGFM